MGQKKSSPGRIATILFALLIVATLSPTALALAKGPVTTDILLQVLTCNFDGICDANENPWYCSDCVCGDDICSKIGPHGETNATCPQDCGYCGDGICDEYSYLPGWKPEDETSCPEDCGGPTATPTPEATETPTPTPTPTEVVAVTPTEVPEGEGIIGIEIPDVAIPSYCQLVIYNTRSSAWQGAYSAMIEVSFSIPAESEIVLVCSDAPSPDEPLCFGLYADLLNAAGQDIDRIGLVDCSAGSCTLLGWAGQQSGPDQICFDIQGAGITCAEGCAIVPLPTAITKGGFLQGPTGTIVFVSVGVILVILAAIVIILLLSRRRKQGEEEAEI